MEETNLEVGLLSPWLGFRPHCRMWGCGPLHGGEVLGGAPPKLVPTVTGQAGNTLLGCRRPKLQAHHWDACKTQWESDQRGDHGEHENSLGPSATGCHPHMLLTATWKEQEGVNTGTRKESHFLLPCSSSTPF